MFSRTARRRRSQAETRARRIAQAVARAGNAAPPPPSNALQVVQPAYQGLVPLVPGHGQVGQAQPMITVNQAVVLVTSIQQADHQRHMEAVSLLLKNQNEEAERNRHFHRELMGQLMERLPPTAALPASLPPTAAPMAAAQPAALPPTAAPMAAAPPVAVPTAAIPPNAAPPVAGGRRRSERAVIAPCRYMPADNRRRLN